MTKMLRRLFHEKRAITAVLSNLLLTVVAVSVMALATTSTYIITTNLHDTMGQRVIIEDLWFNSSTTSMYIYLRNIVQVAIQVSSIYVNHTSQFVQAPFSLGIGAHGWLNVSLDWASGNTYYVDLVTSRGTHVGDYFNAP